MTANQINYQNLQELKRHNISTEFEAVRSNVTREIENNRHNVVGEVETQRHNVIGENETHRHNFVWENETSLHNRITEQETGRHNKQTENIGFAQIAQSYAQLAETARHNSRSELIQYAGNQNSYNLGVERNQLTRDANAIDNVNAATKSREADIHYYDSATKRTDTIWGGVNKSAEILSLFIGKGILKRKGIK